MHSIVDIKDYTGVYIHVYTPAHAFLLRMHTCKSEHKELFRIRRTVQKSPVIVLCTEQIEHISCSYSRFKSCPQYRDLCMYFVSMKTFYSF